MSHHFRRFILTTILVVSSALEAAKQADSQVDNRAAAIIDNQIITNQQVIDSIEEKLYEAEMKVYQLKLNQLKSMLLNRLIKSHPFSQGMKPQDFLNQHVIKNPTASEKEIEQFIKTNRIPVEKINAELKEKVAGYIKNKKAQAAISKWFAVQSKELGVLINLVKPQRLKYEVPIGDAPVLGNKNARITIVEYSDFQCPYCAKAEDTIKQLFKNYPGQIKLVYKNFPLGFHGEAFIAAEAGLCAREQSDAYFWQLHDRMFADPRGLKLVGLKDKATQLGLNVQQFEKCIQDKKYASSVNQDISEGRKLGVNSTPIFFINGIIVKGSKPYADFAKIIDEELAD